MRITRNNSGTASGSRSSGQEPDSSGGQRLNSSGVHEPGPSNPLEATTHIIVTPEKQTSGAISTNLRGSGGAPLPTDTASIPGFSGIHKSTPDVGIGGSEATASGAATSGGKKSNLRKLFACSYCHKKFSYNSSMRVSQHL